MTILNEQQMIHDALSRLPKASIPADLIAAIRRETIYKKAWYESDQVARRWLPALVGLTTALAVLWLAKIQRQSVRVQALPIAAAPRPEEAQHAFLLENESYSLEKGERREHHKS